MYAKVKDQEVRVESHHEESLRGLNTHTSREKRERKERPSIPFVVYNTKVEGV